VPTTASGVTSPAGLDVDLVIFDCDGVLVDSERMEVDTLAIALGWVGADDLDATELHDRRRGGVLADVLADIAEHIERPLPDWFETRYRELQYDRLRSVAPIPGATELVDVVVAAGLERCVVSGGTRHKMEVSLGATGLWNAFSPHIYSCYEIGPHKPDPAIYRHALSMHGATAARCVAIEDSVNGVRAAAGAGIPVVGLARDVAEDDLLGAGATTTIPTMDGGWSAFRRLVARRPAPPRSG
jgi:HAD superfamily hydrolase (TIGR01509 family)